MPNTFFEFKVGALKLVVLTDGHDVMSPAQPFFAPDTDQFDFDRILEENYLPKGEIDVALNILLLMKDDHLILFDTGYGHLMKDSNQLMGSLHNIGLSSKDITDIIITHCHPDHVGGLLDAKDVTVFPNAKIFISDIEYNFWKADSPDFSSSRLDNENIKEFTINLTKKVIQKYDKNIVTFTDGEKIYDCIKATITGGHTPGHSIFEIFDGCSSISHIADISHTATVLLQHPEWGTQLDVDFFAGIKMREYHLQKFASSKKLCFSYHFPWPGLGYVKESNIGYKWIPLSYSTPTLYTHLHQKQI